MKPTRTEKALLAVKRKREITPRQEDALYQEAMSHAPKWFGGDWCAPGSIAKPIIIPMELMDRIRGGARTKRRAAGVTFDSAPGCALLWRDKFFFAPDNPKAGK